MSKYSFLEKIEVQTPCSEDWKEMRGNSEVRFCSHCSKSVNNLSAMSRKKALKIVRESKGNLCVRYIKNPVTNAPVFSGELHQITRRAPRLAVGVMATALSLSSMAYAQGGVDLIDSNTVSQTEVLNEKNADNKKDGAAASISGTITDPNGAVIPGVTITLSSETMGERQAVTNDEGFYEITNLTAGDYTLRADVPGFMMYRIEKLSVTESKNSKQDFSMQSGVESIVMVGLVAISPDYANPLFKAVENENLVEVKNLIARGADVNEKDENFDDITPLFLAVENGNLEIIQTLLDFGAKPNKRDNEKQTPLMRLDEDATPELVRILIKHGAKINLTDKEKNTALILAARSANAEVLQVLIDHQADINAQNEEGQTALMNAAEAGNLEAVRTLILAGADVNLKNKDDETAWDLADNEEIEKLLENYGAKVFDEEETETEGDN